MLSRNIRHLPVNDDNRLVGMVSMRDVLNLRLDELQRETAQLRNFISLTDREPQDDDGQYMPTASATCGVCKDRRGF